MSKVLATFPRLPYDYHILRDGSSLVFPVDGVEAMLAAVSFGCRDK